MLELLLIALSQIYTKIILEANLDGEHLFFPFPFWFFQVLRVHGSLLSHQEPQFIIFCLGMEWCGDTY